jgi:hypothetical protein
MAYEVVFAFIQTYIYIYTYIHCFKNVSMHLRTVRRNMQSLLAQKHVIRLDLGEECYQIGRSRMKQSTIVSQVTTKTFA